MVELISDTRESAFDTSDFGDTGFGSETSGIALLPSQDLNIVDAAVFLAVEGHFSHLLAEARSAHLSTAALAQIIVGMG